MKQDYSSLPEDLKQKLLKWEQNTPANKQVQILSDIADISQEMLSVIEQQKKDSASSLDKLGAVLVDMRNTLISMNDKEAPEAPDTSKPVIDAISKLEKALTGSIKAIDTKPVVNVPQASAPIVNVDAPVVKIDNAEISKILKTDLPKAFNQAIQSIVIPKNDSSATNKLLKDLSDKLTSIDTGVRMKPQSPTTVAVTNPDGSSIGSLSGSTAYENRNDTTTDTNLVYLGKALPGSATSDAAWQIKRYNKSAGHMSFADDVTTFTKIWDSRTGYTY